MKTIIIILLVAVFAFLIIQFFIVMSINKTEEQKYKVVFSAKEFEIRFYPATTLATISLNAKTYKELSGAGFRKLAGYIFGGNETNTSISMTSPVHMDINDTASTMSFVMPSSYNKENLPKPNDPKVLLQETGDEYVAVIRFGGFVSDKKLKLYTEKLQNILKEKEIITFGNYRFLGYNPPFQFIGRRNEVIVSVDWKVQKMP